MRITEEDYQRLLKRRTPAEVAPLAKPGKRQKFNARKTVVDGRTFDSKAEAKRWCELKLLEQAGEIHGLEHHPPAYELRVNGQLICKYEADFIYFQTGVGPVVEDVKSAPTRKLPAYRIKLKLMLACHGIEVRQVWG